MDVEKLLYDEIQSEFEGLGQMELGSENYRATVDGLTKLMDRAIELEKFDIEHQEQVENQKKELDLRMREMKDEKVDRWIKNTINLLGVVSTVGLAVWGTKKSFQFETEGSITTIMGRGWINKLLPKK